MISDYFEPITLLRLTETDDGQGGQTQRWTDDRMISAGVYYTNQAEITAAGQRANARRCMLMYNNPANIPRDTVLRRERDRTLYRVCGESEYTPVVASQRYATAPLEVISL